MVRRYRIATAFVCLLTIVFQADAQEFRPRGQLVQPSKSAQALSSDTPAQNQWKRTSGGDGSGDRPQQPLENPQQSGSSVSKDLLQVYSQTKQVRSETDVTAIAKLCAKVLSDSNRSKTDQEYAASLLAWALNRRGEMRSEQAESLVRAGKIESASQLDSQAADDFATAVRYSPDNWRHRHNFAISLAMKSEYSKAIEQLNKAIELNPDYANAWFNRAELYLETGVYVAADEDYSQAIEISQDAQYYNSRGHCRFLMQSYTLAVEDYRRALELSGTNATYATDLGDACQFLGRWEEAAKSYKQAVAADVQYARAYQNAAWLMATCPDERIRNKELAITAARKALLLTRAKSAEAVETLAAATAATGKYKEAVELQREAVQLASRQRGQEPLQLAEFQQRLELYEAGKAYIQPQPATELISSSPTRTASASPKE